MSTPKLIEPLERAPDTDVVLPGSKSLTNRALVTGALATGRSVLSGALTADDTEAMSSCLSALGAGISWDRSTASVAIEGQSGRILPGPRHLDARLSGTTARFVLALLGLGDGLYELDGEPPLRARPMGEGVEALRGLGAKVTDLGEPGHLPVRVLGPAETSSTLTMDGAVSSQFLSGILLVAPALERGLTVQIPGALVSRPYVAMTVAVMRSFGATVDDAEQGVYVIEPGGYRAADYVIEPDASAASYFFAAAAITGGRVRVTGLGTGSLQGDVAFVDLLERMGAKVNRSPDALEVSGTGLLHGITADLSDLSDTAQTLAVVAAFADTPTEVRGVGFIRGKETDRISSVVTELRRAGIDAEETAEGFVVRPGTPQPARIQTYDDHRMAMSFALMGLRSPGIEIAEPDCVSKTFPGFFEALDRLRGAARGGE